MRDIPAALLTHYQQQVQTTAFCCILSLAHRQPRILNITQADPGVVRCMWPHRFKEGDVVKFVGVEGMTELNFVPVTNEQYYEVTPISATEFSIGVDTTGFTAYVKGSSYGEARRVMGFTEFERDLTWNNVRLHAKTGARPSAVDQSSDMSFSSRDMHALLNSEQITARDIEEGYYSGAEFETFEVNYQDLTDGRHVLQYGRLGDITYGDIDFTAEGLGLLSMLHQNQGPLCSITCRAQLGTRISDTFDERFGCKIKLNPPEWLPFTEYTARVVHDAGIGSVVKPSVYNGRHYVCITPGLSDPAIEPPTWNTTIGGQTVDGGVVWETIDARTKQGSVTSVFDNRTFSDTARTEDERTFTHGLLTFTSGLNSGFATEVKVYEVGSFVLRDPTFRDINVGDTYEVEQGCDKTKRTCIDRFDNIYNMRAEPDIPGFHQQMLYPDAAV